MVGTTQTQTRTVTAASFVAFLVLVNAAILVVGTLWTRRQVRRVAAERAAQYRDLFVLEPPPPPGDEVQILVDDERGMPVELGAVHWPHLGWVDATTLLRVEEEVIGWRWHPFRQRPQDDPATWSREQVAADLEKRFGDPATPRKA